MTSGVARTRDGAELAFEVTGSGDPMLLIAGQAVTRACWDSLIPTLAHSFTVITYDHRGIGPSTMGAESAWTTELLATDAVAVLAATGTPRAHIVGHSMGGRVAQWLGISHAAAAASLGLIATTGGDTPGHRRSRAATETLARGDAASLGPYMFSPAYLAAHPDAMDLLGARDASLRARRGHFVASSTHDTWNRLGEIVSPTLVVHGDADGVTPVSAGRELAARIPDAEYLEVAGGYHALQLEDPMVLETLIAFCRAHPV